MATSEVHHELVHAALCRGWRDLPARVRSARRAWRLARAEADDRIAVLEEAKKHGGWTRWRCELNGGHFWPVDRDESVPSACERCGYNPGWKPGPGPVAAEFGEADRG